MGGGFPIGACLANKKASQVFLPGNHGNTFGGNPWAGSVALTVLDEIESKGLLENVQITDEYLVEKLNLLKEMFSIIKDVRGMGLLIGMKLEKEPKNFQSMAFEKGLLIATAGKNVVRFLPPLNVTKEEIDEMLTILEAVLEES